MNTDAEVHTGLGNDEPFEDPITWRYELICNAKGDPRRLLANAIYALRWAPEWKGVVAYDAFSNVTVARLAPPWIVDHSGWVSRPWTDEDDLRLTEWLQWRDILVPVSVAAQAIEAVARESEFHPVRDYLDGLEWDGTSRIDTWLHRYLGAENNTYTRTVGARFLISAIARIYKPGCKADHVLVLEGKQGIGKSSALKVLGGPWFTDRLSDLKSKDSAVETRGVWIVEIAELDGMSRAELSTIKAFFSRSYDRFRPPYAKRLVNLARQCVFAGSINPEQGYLKDGTGARRFWPVCCDVIDIDALARDLDLIWAEARDRFQAGEVWWLDTPELQQLAAEEQSDRYQRDAWEDLIADYLLSLQRQDISVAEALQHAICVDRSRWSQSDQNRAVRCLVALGFSRYRARHGGHGTKAKREWRYRKTE